MLCVYAVMSLQDFIRVTVKNIQDAVTKKAAPAKQPPPERMTPEASRKKNSATEEEEEVKKDVPALIRKKSRRGDRA